MLIVEHTSNLGEPLKFQERKKKLGRKGLLPIKEDVQEKHSSLYRQENQFYFQKQCWNFD